MMPVSVVVIATDPEVTMYKAVLYWAAVSVLMCCGAPAEPEPLEPIDTSVFLDAINHWQKKYGRDRDDARYAPEQVTEIADNLLQYQNPDGGWPKDVDWLAIIPKEEVQRLRGHTLERSTLDNRTTYTHIAYLAEAFVRTGETRFRTAAERGLDYILAEQRPTGGWRGADVDAITFNDDLMVGVMRLLSEIRDDSPRFAWLDGARRERLAQALDKAIAATLRCQIEVNGTKTAWCQQHDHVTFQPVKARRYELPSICAAESVGVVRFLMELPEPSGEVIAAVEAAVAWFRAVAIPGVRLEKVPITPERFDNHTATSDIVATPDPNAMPIWTRYYEVETNRPFFCRRDGTVVYTLAEVDLERRTGYGWYGYWPASLLEQAYPAWKQQIQSGQG